MQYINHALALRRPGRAPENGTEGTPFLRQAGWYNKCLRMGNNILPVHNIFYASFCGWQGKNIITDISIAKRAIFIKKGMFPKIKIIKVD
jgi:hypothetical protein